MADDKSKDTGTSGEEDKGSNISNNDVKGHPLFKKLTQELSSERKINSEISERLAILEKAESEREAKKLETKKKYDEALEKRIEQAQKEAREKWEAEQSVKDKIAEARLQLVKAGFKNEKFVKGALADFDPSKTSAEEFAKSILDDESNKPFLDAGKGSGHTPDPHPTPRSGSKLLTPAEIQTLRESGDAKDIARANQAARALWVANQGSTGLPT